MYSPITLDALRTLDAIDRRRSFAAAADELFRVPSAVSYTISKLENDLGVELFDRSRRKAELTAVGRLLLEQGRQILTATEELTAMAKQAADGWEMELRICIDSVLKCDPIYDLIEAFQKVQPRTEVRLIEEVLGGTWDALNAERCDIVIGAEGDPPSQGFGIHALGQVLFEFAIAAGHPLTKMPQPLPLSAIQDYPIVVVADSSRYLPARSTGLLDGRSRIVMPSIERKIEAQCKGLGVGYLPRHRINEELESGRLVSIQLEEPRPPQSLSVAWRNTNKGKGLKWFISRLKKMYFGADQGLCTLPEKR
ncbi:LysR substrate-binding domain-containing protein [Marinobacterium sedimentorum]|uniref:LysR substrate-binding domain-containing protein n=1 Tax=Marinobacterium sedimentorum TaxID=2927804 RepID=UPI0020C61B50|nr:LysR substrate-binding domain-containing protein [Marinobacterium sedimentorum]MCP8688708.1 LysR substrate-binding domain-containing protein [Marinobacterium sedimentorum]